MAAEIFQSGNYSFSLDMFAVGTVLYELLAFTPCFPSIPNTLAHTHTPLDTALGYSAGLCELAMMLLSADPSRRPSAAAVLENPVLVRGRVQTLESTVSALRRTAAEQQQTIDMLQRTVSEQQQANVRLERSVAEHAATVGVLEGTVSGLVQSVRAFIPQRLQMAPVSPAAPAVPSETVYPIVFAPQPSLAGIVVR